METLGMPIAQTPIVAGETEVARTAACSPACGRAVPPSQSVLMKPFSWQSDPGSGFCGRRGFQQNRHKHTADWREVCWIKMRRCVFVDRRKRGTDEELIHAR